MQWRAVRVAVQLQVSPLGALLPLHYPCAHFKLSSRPWQSTLSWKPAGCYAPTAPSLCNFQAIQRALALHPFMEAGTVAIVPANKFAQSRDHAWGFDGDILLACREFKLSEDMYAHDSIDLLKDSGIDFPRNEAQGIDVQRFGELLISSGIVLNDEVSWQHGLGSLIPTPLIP